ncbi:MAG: Dabb family protein [Parvibaculaceae bacterium]|nr:Dabb family protein [Parvibaculaceae bacterium]
MKKIWIIVPAVLVAIFLLFAACVAGVTLAAKSPAHTGSRNASGSAVSVLSTELGRVGVEAFTAPDYKPGTIKHVVLFRYAAEVDDARKEEVIKRFLALKDQARRNGVPYIREIETGAQTSGEGMAHGFEQAFVVTFNSEGDRNYYVGTPVVTDLSHVDGAHAAFKKFVEPFLEKGQDGVLVFDFRPD